MTTGRRFVLGNWKSNTSREEARALAWHLAKVETSDVFVGVAPPFPWLADVQSVLSQSTLAIGAQNCSAHGSGAFTGEVTAGMVAELCTFVLLGHSERRALFGESDEMVRAKLSQVLETDLIPVLCVGETLSDRQNGDAEHVVARQLQSASTGMTSSSLGRLIVAYEPVWAIGTGVNATVDDANAMATFIGSELERTASTKVPILYGGSVNAGNAAELMAADAIAGFLVGGASLRKDEFSRIIEAAIA